MHLESAASASQQYGNPPILEASLTIHIVPIGPERHGLLGSVGQRLGKAFSKVEVLSDFQRGYIKPAAGAVGVVYTSEDDADSVQARSDGFSFSRQAPYEGWERFLPKAREAWLAYRDMVSPISIRAFSVKFINSISIPFGVPLPELFNTFPAYPNPSQLFDAITMSYKISLKEIDRAQLSVLMTNRPNATILLDNTITVAARASEDDIWESYANRA